MPLVHVSTDYVFDGSGDRPWREDDPTAPLNLYGQTKLEGEHAIWRTTDRAAVIRTSWVVSERAGNFLTTMLRLGAERETLRVVADHFANAGATTWAGLAEAVLAEAGIATPVEQITTAEWPTPARRPFNSVLDTGKVERTFGVTPRPWRAAIGEAVAQIMEQA